MSDDLSPEEAAIYYAELAVAERLTEQAMAPYRKLLSPKKLEGMRDMLIEVLMTHPNAAPLVEALAKRTAFGVSGEVGEERPASEAADGSTKK